MDRRWLAGRELSPDADFRLFCLPYAGGGAAVYRGWQQMAPAGVEVVALEPPGRGTRLREAPFLRLAPLIRAMADAVADALDRPYALFGHSMGGLLVFELARALRRRPVRQPAHVFVSAAASPGSAPTRPLLHCATDDEIRQRLAQLGGTPPDLLNNAELMELMLPVLRADFSVLETYEHRPEPPLSVPLTVCGGRADRIVPPKALDGWQRHTSAGSRLCLFPGDHFFLHRATADVLATVVQDLGVAAVAGRPATPLTHPEPDPPPDPIQTTTATGSPGPSVRTGPILRRPAMTTLDSVTSQQPDEADIEPFTLLSPRDRKVVPAGAVDAYPLPEAQAELVEHESAFAEVDLAGRRVCDPTPFCPERFASAVRAVVRAHELLRTSIDPTGGTEPLCRVHPDAAIPVARYDHRSVDEAKRETMLAALRETELATPFDPAAAGPLRLTVVLETEQSWTLLVAAPRALTFVADPAGIVAELLRAYHGDPVAGTRHAPCVAAGLDAAADFDGEEYWTRLLAGTACALPSGWGGEPGDTELTVDVADLSPGLAVLAEVTGVPLSTVLLAAHQTVLGMLNAEPAGHTEATLAPHAAAATGCERLLHRVTLPVPMATGAATWRELVTEVAEGERAAWTHRYAYRPAATGQRQHALFEWDATGGEPVPGLPVDGTAYGLRVTAGPDRLRLRAAGETVDPGYARRLAALYREVLVAMAADPDGDARGAYLPADERRAVLLDWAVAETVERGGVIVVDLIRAQAEATPDRVAVRVGDTRLTYRELMRRANRLTHHLLDLGVGRDMLVGVCLGRTPDLVPALIGVWQTGAGYLPLDPQLPPERLRHMIEAAGSRVVITSTVQQPTLTDLYDGTLVLVDADAAAIAARPDTPVDVPIHPAQLAYVIFTSGSTGRPKGVMVPHAGLVNYLLWTVDAYAAHGPGGAPVFSSISFDLGIPNIFTPLITGEPVHLLPEPLDPADLGAHLLAGAPYSFIKMTPGHLDLLTWQLTGEQARDLAGIVIAAGDSFTQALAARWLELAGPDGTKVATEYGPTEITIGNSGQQVTEPPATELVPLGAPIVNTTMYVLTDRLEPVPVGVPGEVYIGGVGVARGYLGRPDLTAERFLPDPYGAPGSRLYRSGDLARWLPDGTLEFLGRIDNQVKIRGYRVELGEIQARLAAHPHVRDAVVIAREPSPGEKRLVAYVVLAAGHRLDPAALRAHLTADLPDYMIPTDFVAIDHIPLTTNGKVDSRALPAC